MATKYSGVRISPKDVVKAYAHLTKHSNGKTKAARQVYVDGTTKCGLPRRVCALSALVLCSTKAGKTFKARTKFVQSRLDSDENVQVSFAGVLGATPIYVEGFIHGFDSGKFDSFRESDFERRHSRVARLGYLDGQEAARAVFSKKSV